MNISASHANLLPTQLSVDLSVQMKKPLAHYYEYERKM